MTYLSINTYLIVSTIICGIITIILNRLKKQRLYKLASKLPGPRPIPLLGNALMFVGNPEDIYDAMYKQFESYPSPSRLWLGPHLEIVYSEPEQFEQILRSDNMVNKHYMYGFTEPLLGLGLVTAPGELWRAHRKLIAPTFNSNTIKSFVNIFYKQSKIFVKKLHAREGASEFDIFKELGGFTLDTICETTMGSETTPESQQHSEFGTAIEDAFEICCDRMMTAWLHPDLIFNFTRSSETLKKCSNTYRSFCDRIIQKKKIEAFGSHEDREKPLYATQPIERDSTLTKKVLLDHLMEPSSNGLRLTDKQLHDEVATIVAAGNHSTGLSITFVLMILAYYQDIQEKVCQELREIYENDYERDVTYEDTHCMKYMERVIKETLRIFSPIPFIGRTATEDVVIGKHTLPRGTSVMLGISNIHRNDKYWPDPLKFEPDRFLPEEIAKRHTYCYLPFGAGKRDCVGTKYAITIIKVLLTTLLRKYNIRKTDITPIADIKFAMNLVLKPSVPITVGIDRRKPTA